MSEKKNIRHEDTPQRKSGRRATTAKDGFADEPWQDLPPAPDGSPMLAKPNGKATNGSWLKKNPNAVKGIAAGGVLVVLLVLVGLQLGWFGSDAPQAPAAQPVAASAAAPVIKSPATPVASASVTSTPPASPAASLTKTEPAKPDVAAKQDAKDPAKKDPAETARDAPLSDDVTQWKIEDFFRARRENNPRLLLVVAQLGDKAQGNAAAAQSLVALLKPLPPQARPAEPKPGVGEGAQNPALPPTASTTPIDATHFVESIIIALGNIGTEVSQQTFEAILAATLATDDDKTAVEAVLKSLVMHSSKENDALLLRVILTPDKLRPLERQGPWSARDLRAKAFEFIKMAASVDFRTKLAEALADRLLRLPTGDPIREFLLAPDPRNCGAQIVIYQKAEPSKEIKAKIEQQLTSYGSSVLGRMLEITSAAPDSSPSAQAISPELSKFAARRPGDDSLVRGAEGTMAANPATVVSGKVEVPNFSPITDRLWGEKFRAGLESDLVKIPSLEKQASLVVLASTMPLDSTRAALAKVLRKRWNDGPPKGLDMGGDAQIGDPGFLVLLKMNPRRQVKTNSGSTPVATSRSGRSNGAAGRSGNGSGSLAERRERSEQEWMAISSKLITTWCTRFHAVSLAKDKAAADSGSLAPNAKPKMPGDVTLSEGAKVLASHRVQWPSALPAGTGEQKPGALEVRYVRFEETSKPRKLIAYYSRQFTGKVETRTWEKGGVWLDSQRMVPQTDRRRSVDVVITRMDNSQTTDLMKDNEEGDLIVEMLSVEIKDPRD